MRDFPTGVRYYTFGTVDIGFPEDKVCCEYCPFLETYARKQCRRTGEYLMDTRGIGYYCPIIFNEIKENET